MRPETNEKIDDEKCDTAHNQQSDGDNSNSNTKSTKILLIHVFVISFFIDLCSDGIFSIIPLYSNLKFDVSSFEVGWVMFGAFIFSAISNPLSAYICSYVGYRNGFIICAVAFLISILCQMFATSWIILAIGISIQAFCATLWTLGTGLFAELLTPKKVVIISSYYRAMNAAGNVLGSMTIGILFELDGFKGVYTGCLSLSIFCVIYGSIFILTKQTNSKKHRSEVIMSVEFLKLVSLELVLVYLVILLLWAGAHSYATWYRYYMLHRYNVSVFSSSFSVTGMIIGFVIAAICVPILIDKIKQCVNKQSSDRSDIDKTPKTTAIDDGKISKIHLTITKVVMMIISILATVAMLACYYAQNGWLYWMINIFLGMCVGAIDMGVTILSCGIVPKEHIGNANAVMTGAAFIGQAIGNLFMGIGIHDHILWFVYVTMAILAAISVVAVFIVILSFRKVTIQTFDHDDTKT
eukprot:144563_1